MEELDLLKKDWNRKKSFEEISEHDIYKMSHKSSSSIVKWLLIISIIEFAFWMILTVVLNDDQYQVKLHRYGIEDIIFWINVVNYIILVAFIFVFYRNYKTISVTDSTQRLMQTILKTRRTVQYYIWYNLGIVVVNIILTILMLFKHNPQVLALIAEAEAKGDKMFFITKCIGISVLFIAVIIILFWLFYRLLYGILLKKLFANYKELKKIDL